MSLAERSIQHKPASEWTDEEWHAHQRAVDLAREERGEPPMDWRGVRKPRAVSAAALDHLRSLKREDA
jgi:hypothetical protein